MSGKTQYHVNNDGEVGKCTADVRSCKYAKDGVLPEHFDSVEDAMSAYEASQSESTFPSARKPAPKETEESPAYAKWMEDFNGLGIKPVSLLDLAVYDYTFDLVGVWRDKNGGFYMGTDSGCSCPTPFENYNDLEDFTGPLTADQVIEEATSIWKAVGALEKKDDLMAFIKSISDEKAKKEPVYAPYGTDPLGAPLPETINEKSDLSLMGPRDRMDVAVFSAMSESTIDKSHEGWGFIVSGSNAKNLNLLGVKTKKIPGENSFFVEDSELKYRKIEDFQKDGYSFEMVRGSLREESNKGYGTFDSIGDEGVSTIVDVVMTNPKGEKAVVTFKNKLGFTDLLKSLYENSIGEHTY